MLVTYVSYTRPMYCIKFVLMASIYSYLPVINFQSMEQFVLKIANGPTIAVRFKFITMACGIPFVLVTGMILQQVSCVLHLDMELKDRCIKLMPTIMRPFECSAMGMKLSLCNALIIVGVASECDFGSVVFCPLQGRKCLVLSGHTSRPTCILMLGELIVFGLDDYLHLHTHAHPPHIPPTHLPHTHPHQHPTHTHTHTHPHTPTHTPTPHTHTHTHPQIKYQRFSCNGVTSVWHKLTMAMDPDSKRDPGHAGEIEIHKKRRKEGKTD